MILLQLYPHGVSVVPLKGDAPRAVDVHAVALWTSSQGVEVEPGYVQVLQARGGIERIQSPQRSRLEVRQDPSSVALLEQLSQPLVPEAPDHDPLCNIRRYTLSTEVRHLVI
jgi:hypothetical protein